MKRSCLFLSLIMLITPLYAQIYKWTDSSGSVHFSDKPHPGAEEVDLPTTQTYSVPPIPAVPSQETQSEESKTEVSAYHKFLIVEPEDQSTSRDNQGAIMVKLQIDPPLNEGDKIQIVLDDAPVGQPQATTVFALSGLNRGSHAIFAEIINADGKVVKTSAPITVFMQRPRVGMVPETRRAP